VGGWETKKKGNVVFFDRNKKKKPIVCLVSAYIEVIIKSETSRNRERERGREREIEKKHPPFIIYGKRKKIDFFFPLYSFFFSTMLDVSEFGAEREKKSKGIPKVFFLKYP
jgi:hypothetical protein